MICTNQRVVIDTTQMDWQASPSPGVWRKRLELVGPQEAGRVTSIVRYDPGSSFSSHDHPDGEEILVLEGVFSDEQGDHRAGSYLLNPEGFRHAPFSEAGCTLFVKLRQYAGRDRDQIHRNIDDLRWQPSDLPGVSVKPLYAQPGYCDRTWLEQWQPGAIALRDHSTKTEMLVLEGSLVDEQGQYPTGTWLRIPPQPNQEWTSPDGCLLYVKTGGG